MGGEGGRGERRSEAEEREPGERRRFFREAPTIRPHYFVLRV